MITVVQNDLDTPPGLTELILRNHGVCYRIVRAYLGLPLRLENEERGVIVLGGAMGVHDLEAFPYLREVASFMSRTLARGLPLLGICLGGNVLAKVLGARVHSGRNGEVGIREITLTSAGIKDALFLDIPPSFTDVSLAQGFL